MERRQRNIQILIKSPENTQVRVRINMPVLDVKQTKNLFLANSVIKVRALKTVELHTLKTSRRRILNR